MDVDESSDAVQLTFEIPGVDADDLKVTVDNGVLTVSGEKKSEREVADDRAGSRVFERQYGRFERSVALPQSVDAEKVTAHFANGVLTIALPKTAEARSRTIEIGRGKARKRLWPGKGDRSAA